MPTIGYRHSRRSGRPKRTLFTTTVEFSRRGGGHHGRPLVTFSSQPDGLVHASERHPGGKLTPHRERQLPAMQVRVRGAVRALGYVDLVVAEVPPEDVHQAIDVERLGDSVGDQRAVV